MMQNKIFIDLDGTLIDDEYNLHQEDINSIKGALDDGYEVYFSSGRPYSFINWMIEKVDKRIKTIAFNGMYFSGHYQYYLDKEDIIQITSLTDKYILKSLEGYYANQQEIPDVFSYEYLEDYPRLTLETFDFTKSLKVLIYDHSNSLSEKLNKINGLNITEYVDKGFEIANKGIDKGYPLKLLKDKQQLTIYSIGNDVNDIPMFKQSDHYYVIGEAVKGTKVKSVSEAISKIRRI